jgi:GNAT superfamily N-acetyltransferase
MSNLSIRRATPADVEVVTRFNIALADQSEGLALDPAVVRLGVAAVLGDPDKGDYWLATFGDRVVGQLMIIREWSDWRNAWWWWIQSVYVERDARGHGVYDALHAHVIARAEQEGVRGVRLYVEHENVRAMRAYERVGMQPGHYRIYEQVLGGGRGD